MWREKGREQGERMTISLSKDEERDFDREIRSLASDPRCLRMKQFIQHGRITTYEHSMNVAREAFRLNREWHAGADEKRLITAAFLHDYFLYDWHTHGDRLHGYHHPRIAAENAGRDFRVSARTQKIILSHMWPLTFFHVPTSREAWLVTLADKICSARETLFERGRTGSC